MSILRLFALTLLIGSIALAADQKRKPANAPIKELDDLSRQMLQRSACFMSISSAMLNKFEIDVNANCDGDDLKLVVITGGQDRKTISALTLIVGQLVDKGLIPMSCSEQAASCWFVNPRH